MTLVYMYISDKQYLKLGDISEHLISPGAQGTLERNT